ncbi:uracil-DNA glycosylase [Syntrophotalea acetylenivorans]|uniref:Type-5 uracil-DNA glycosylase n=1 Tax=Syntrophotalea acetylenivorans TaxID=1842532 RepID=A0A1L3GT17_9BACT|nr:uracil-DNA glycosylase [Syntrophotalea acetylenivorans]APG29059.1 uracil-DNA glycosylase [Syntrophotalea acetylenivorans]
MPTASLDKLSTCRQCSRLVDYMASVKPRRGLSVKDYWNGPVAGFGDPAARVFLVGLAPGAHGANRTGRPFTGDGAGDFMYPLLHQAGFASQAEASHADDGLQLYDLYISNAVKCLPPDNKPIAAEFANCRPYLLAEQQRLSQLKVVVLLGRGAYDSYLRLYRDLGEIDRLKDYPFAHGAVHRLPNGLQIVACYHTSRYNVQTGRMTKTMFLELLSVVRQLLSQENG